MHQGGPKKWFLYVFNWNFQRAWNVATPGQCTMLSGDTLSQWVWYRTVQLKYRESSVSDLNRRDDENVSLTEKPCYAYTSHSMHGGQKLHRVA